MTKDRLSEIEHAVEQNGKNSDYGDGFWEACGAEIAKELLDYIKELE